MPESEADNNSMVAVENGRAGEGTTSPGGTTANVIRIEEEGALHERSRVRSRLHDILVTISSLAVPLLIVTLLLFPCFIVVVVLVGVCLVPTLLVSCVGCILYLFCPETSSTFALLWGSQRRWDMDRTLTNYLESLEPRSREHLETLLIVKTVVEGGPFPEDDSDIEQGIRVTGEGETKVPESQDDEEDEMSIARDGEKGETGKDIKSGNAAEPKAKVFTKREPVLDFDPKTMIHLNEISKSCCDVCMMDYELDEKVSQSKHVDCDHIFHKECILDWMQKKHTCPCCRRNYLGEERNDDIVTPGWRENT